MTANRSRVDAEGRRGLGQRALQHIAENERTEVHTAHGVPADEIAEARTKQSTAPHGVGHGIRGLPVELGDAQERGDLAGRELARVLEARDEALYHDVIRDGRTLALPRHRPDRGERRGERASKAVQIRELHDVDDGRIPEQETRDRPVALRDDDHRDGVLACELNLDAHSERWNARICDENRGARDMRTVELIDGARIQVRRGDRVSDAVRQIRTQAGGFGDLGEDLVEELRARRILERGERPRDVRLADRDWSAVPRLVHGPLMMLGASSCARRIRPMPEMRVAEHLKRLPLFSRLPETELAELAERVRTKTFRRGEMIFRKDDPGTHLYMVLEGGVKIALPGEFGQEALVAIMRPGEFFGELALFDRSPRSASATALEETRAALLAGDDFLSYLESHPASFRVVLETLARTIRRLSDRVEDLIFLDVPSRVAKYLLDLVRSSGDGKNELTLTQDELAAFIGASRVSVNRVLGDLERREIISIRRRRIAIKDPDRLAKEVRF
jgi:CRP/FNR family cyclic AMP-dependent transcriptional regulator